MSLMSDASIDDLLTAMNYHPERDYKPIIGPDELPLKDQAVLIAPPQAGKTAIVTGMFKRANAKVYENLHTDCKWRCKILEKGSNIHDDVSRLSDGLFPGKTQIFLGFRSSPGLLLEQQKQWAMKVPFTAKIFGRQDDLRPARDVWHKAKQTTFLDLPGETLSKLMWQYRQKVGEDKGKMRETIGGAIVEARTCSEVMLILNCGKAHGLGLPIDTETDPNVCSDPDVSLTRMFVDIASDKAKKGERIKAAYVILAATDKIAKKAERYRFDLLDRHLVKRQRTLEAFTAKCFEQFFGALHSWGIPESKIRYYPTFFETEKTPDGSEIMYDDPMEYTAADGTKIMTAARRPHIIVKDLDDDNARDVWQNVRGISYSEETFDTLMTDLMETAPSIRGAIQ